MKVVVTGAGGFLGAAVCQVLGREGHTVIRILRKTSTQESRLADAICLDLQDSKAAGEIVSVRPDAIIHFAACVPADHLGPMAERAASINRRIDATAFRVLEQVPAKMVYASSLSVYGQTAAQTVDERTPTNPWGPYASVKLEGEEICKHLSGAQRPGFIALRIGASYGPGQRARTVLRTFVENAMQGLPLLYHGTGLREQDFVFSLDVAEAVRCALERGRDGVYNVATGTPTTMRRLAELAVDCVPGSSSVVTASEQLDPQEGVRARYDIRKAQSELGWRPGVSLAVGIVACVREWSSRMSS